MRAIVALPRTFASRYGVPVIRSVDTEIFTRRYFTHCMQCGFCQDQCCSHGVDVDLRALEEIERHTPALEAFTGILRNEWFESGIERDDTSPGGGAVRTRVRDGRCVFLSRKGRGCMIHTWCLERGPDYHDLKPLVDCLFPVTYDGDTLVPSEEVDDGTLICLDTGPTLYRGARPELAYYFGEGLIETLDTMESSVTAQIGGG